MRIGVVVVVSCFAACVRIGYGDSPTGAGDGANRDAARDSAFRDAARDGAFRDAARDTVLVDAARDTRLPDAGSQVPSCRSLPATCGASGVESCCASSLVTGGTFYRSFDTATDGRFSDQSYPATVSDFKLDRFEVTVGRFRAFVTAGQGTQTKPPAAGDGAHALIPGSGWDPSWNSKLASDSAALVAALNCDAELQTWTDAPGTHEQLPINCITFYEAMAFCAWDGGFLPTEAEWNYAAAGGSDQRAFPWSNPAATTTLDESHAAYSCIADGVTSCGITDFHPVGSKPSGDARWGQADLAGSVWEWVLDWYSSPYPMPCTDCAQLTFNPLHIIRGGAVGSNATGLRVANRDNNSPSIRIYAIGVRCARHP